MFKYLFHGWCEVSDLYAAVAALCNMLSIDRQERLQ